MDPFWRPYYWTLVIHGATAELCRQEFTAKNPRFLPGASGWLAEVPDGRVVRLEVARRERHPEYAILPESSLPELKKACLERIGHWAKLNQGHYRFTDILAAWKTWGTDEISKWVANFISTEEGLLHFLRAFLGQIELNSPFTDDHLRPTMMFMESFVSLDKISEKITEFKLTASVEHSVAVYQEGIKVFKRPAKRQN